MSLILARSSGLRRSGLWWGVHVIRVGCSRLTAWGLGGCVGGRSSVGRRRLGGRMCWSFVCTNLSFLQSVLVHMDWREGIYPSASITSREEWPPIAREENVRAVAPINRSRYVFPGSTSITLKLALQAVPFAVPPPFPLTNIA
jgi:hypothetical protein